MDDKFRIVYDDTEEDCPILVIDGKMEICLFRGYYFQSSRNKHGKLNEWKNYLALDGNQRINYLFSELVPAFADNMDDLHTLLSVFPGVLEEFINASLKFYYKKPIFSAEQLNLTRDSAEELPYKNQLYIRAFTKSRELNPVALGYLVGEDLIGTYSYLDSIKGEINETITKYNDECGTLYGLEQMLFAIDKDFDSKIGLYDASGLRYLLVRYFDWLQASKPNTEDTVKPMNMFEGK